MRNKISKHHLIPKHTENGVRWTNHIENIKELKTFTHRAFHYIFSNDNPQQQFNKLFELNKTALWWEVKSDIIKILDQNDLSYWYNRKCLK